MVVMTINEAYQILGVSSSSPESEVKTAYKRMALQTHPDKNPNDPEARAKFQRVSEAYKRITDPDSFQDEEEMGFEDLNEMFTSMFSDMMGMSGNSMGGGMGDMPFEMFEMMMAGMMMEEMGMGGMPGFAFEEPDSDDEDDVDRRAMEAFLAMQEGRCGMGAYGASGEHDSDEGYEYEDDDEDGMLDFMRSMNSGMGGISMEDIMMMQLMGGGAGLDGLDIDELAHMMGGDYPSGSHGRGRGGTGRGRHSRGSRGGRGGAADSRGSGRGKGGRGGGSNINANRPYGYTSDGPKLHSHMYKNSSAAGVSASKKDTTKPTRTSEEWLSDSDEEGGTKQCLGSGASNGPRVKKTVKKNKKKKKAAAKKSSASPANPSPQEPQVSGTEPLSSADHFTPYPRGMIRPGTGIHNDCGLYDDDDEEDITADEMAELMAAMLGGGGGSMMGVAGGESTRRPLQPPSSSSETRHYNTDKTRQHPVPAPPPPTSAPPAGKANAGGIRAASANKAAGSDGEECFLAMGDKVMVHDRHAGTVAFIGSVSYAQGEFVGVIMDEEVGKNNGTIKGVTYFKCPPRRGLMVRPNEMRPLSLGDDF